MMVAWTRGAVVEACRSGRILDVLKVELIGFAVGFDMRCD